VFDTVLLGKALFDQGLRAVLEDTKSIKIFFDARRDSDAMYHQFGVKLQCVLDCQILDLALRKQSGLNSKFRTGLSACLENYLPDLAQQFQFKAIKKQTVTRFAPEQGGDPELWGKRPMDQGLLQYATFDVVFLRVLAATIQAQLQPFFNSRAWEFSALNVASIRDLADHEITKENSSAAAPAGF
jgi:exonuclease 3'-5' domain-containing protein 1